MTFAMMTLLPALSHLTLRHCGT